VTDPVREWILKASQLKDPIVEVAGDVNWLLLGCALQQGINLFDLQNFLAELKKEIGDIAELPAPAENIISKAIPKCGLRNWSFAPQAAGIIWSVGRFIRARKNRLDLWVQSRTASDIWRECGEIFYMGKTSPLRPKALTFLFRVTEFAMPLQKPPHPLLPSSAGARRWLIKSEIYDVNDTPKEKLKAVNSFYKELFPKNPALACHALQFFAEPMGEGNYFCQKLFRCEGCLVAEYCGWQC
jgi:hypothetical protein